MISGCWHFLYLLALGRVALGNLSFVCVLFFKERDLLVNIHINCQKVSNVHSYSSHCSLRDGILCLACLTYVVFTL